MRKNEENLHLKICDFLRKNYPDVIFRTDFSSGMKMTPGQAIKHKKFQSSRAFPDLTIFEPRIAEFGGEEVVCHALMLEIKAENASPFKKDGSLKKNQHLEEQGEMLRKLWRRDYLAVFVVGFDQAKQVIENYLGEPKRKEIEF